MPVCQDDYFYLESGYYDFRRIRITSKSHINKLDIIVELKLERIYDKTI